jgi:hypothetical protein
MTSAREEFESLKAPPPDAEKQWFSERGRSLELIIARVLEDEGLDPRLRFRPKGEEIDGSFNHGGRVYLLEAKWTKAAIPASELYAFRGKVEGKLVGTIGVFISIGGYSEDAVDALVAGKTLNLILFDGTDFEAVLDPGVGFTRVLQAKLRAAAESGSPLVSFETTTTSVASTKRLPLDEPLPPAATVAELGPALIICEGQTDELILSVLVRRLLREHNIDRNVRILVARGIYNLPRVALAAAAIGAELKRAVVLDSDHGAERALQRIESQLNLDEWRIIIADPNTDTSLRLSSGARKPQIQELLSQMESIDIIDLAVRVSWVRELRDFISSA